ncbi:MAG: hypothetical protein JRN52_05140 [Nitrososphaerota archaeon]|nr:hypothetical protein [Nitrososphaerota archaeon]
MQRQVRVLEGKSMESFLKGFNSEATKESYYKKLGQFLEFHSITPDEFLQKTIQDHKFAEHCIIDYVEARRKQVSGSTFRQTRDALKHFFEMNDLDNGINWPKINKLIPRGRKVGSDRAPSVEEIRSIIENSDMRTKCIVLLPTSGGFRVGAFDYLTWGDVKPIVRNSQVVAARLTIYRGEPEEYITFITPEAYNCLLEYKARRGAIGEVITKDSPLIRDAWDSNKYRKYKKQNPSEAKPLSSKAIANQMGVLLKKIGIRDSESRLRYEFKQIHGFRKFFETNAGRGLKPLDIKVLMGTKYNYYKPTEEYLLEEYLKVVKYLTIAETFELKDKLERQIVVSDRKVGELERDNLFLQNRLGKIEQSYEELKKLVESRMLQPVAKDVPR